MARTNSNRDAKPKTALDVWRETRPEPQVGEAYLEGQVGGPPIQKHWTAGVLMGHSTQCSTCAEVIPSWTPHYVKVIRPTFGPNNKLAYDVDRHCQGCHQ